MAEIISVKTHSRTEMIDITNKVQAVISKSKIKKGLVHIFIPHTTAAVTINENADPSVQTDIINGLNKIVPANGDYQHSEGNSDAHIKSTLVGASEVIAIENSQMVLGTWQGVFFCEFDGPRNRKVHINIEGK